MFKNPIFALKNPYFITNFPDIKIIVELTILSFKQAKTRSNVNNRSDFITDSLLPSIQVFFQ